jgi:hypothetical protein
MAFFFYLFSQAIQKIDLFFFQQYRRSFRVAQHNALLRIHNIEIYTSRKEKKAIASSYSYFSMAFNNPFFHVLLRFDAFDVNVQFHTGINQGPYYVRMRQLITAVLFRQFA